MLRGHKYDSSMCSRGRSSRLHSDYLRYVGHDEFQSWSTSLLCKDLTTFL